MVHVGSVCLENQNRFFSYGLSSWLMRAVLYTYTNKPIQYYETDVLCWVRVLPGPYANLCVSRPIIILSLFN